MSGEVSSERQRLSGIALMCGALVMFACLDTTAKYLNAFLPTLVIVWARYVSGLGFVLFFVNPVTKPDLLRTKRPMLQVVRALLLLASTIFNFMALRYLQLDQTTAIMFSTPFLVALASGPLLGEWIGWRRWIAISVGFVGVLLVARPGAGGIHPAALLSVGGAISYAFYLITTRLLARTDANDTTWFYTNGVGAVVMTAIVPFIWVAPQSWFEVALLIMAGALGSFGHRLLIQAHRFAPAAVLSPFIYTQVVSMSVLGFLVFGDVPNAWTITGAAIVIGAGLYLLNRERSYLKRNA